MPSPLPATIASALASGMTVLTPNQRAARSLRRAYERTQQTSLWTPPPILPLDTWLPTLFHRLLLDGAESRILLNPTQQHALWREIVAADPAVSGLRSFDSLAEMAANAWRLLHLHNGHNRLRDFNVSTDTRAFQRWAAAFERQTTRHQLITDAELPAALLEHLAEGALAIPDQGLALVDFDILAPAHDILLESIARAGFAVERIATDVPTSATLHIASDDRAELRTAALWAARHLDRNPTIAIVVPNLADRRPQLNRVFHELLPPNSFEFSLGRPLAETSLAATALALLRWPLEPLQLDEITALLLSPFFGASNPDEALAAAEFDAFELRTAPLLRPELPLDAMIDLVRASKHRGQRLTPLRIRLHLIARTAAEEQMIPPQPNLQGPRQSHAGWAEAFRKLLEAAGWTAAANDSLAFQTLRRWESCLDELATLDFDASTVSASAALKTLTRIARQAIFAPESTGAPIQIVGPLEPGGIPFDALWFLAADDESWPSTISANPMIPWHIQRELNIPGVNPAQDTTHAQSLTQRLAQSAPETVFSYAARSEEGDRRPSPLLRTLSLTPLDAPPSDPPFRPLKLESIPDDEPLPPLPSGTTPGGARVLELQAACAFRAFAEIRLASTQPGARSLGLDARDRGIQVHRIMQIFWTRIQSQENLRALPTPERDTLLDTAIDLAIRDAASAARTPWDEAYLDVQRRRLRSLLRPWLDFETTRPPFEVRQQEKKSLYTIGPIQLELRADRIDQTGAGPLILDYKTGLATPADWLSDRPDAPQLPLYAVMAAAQEDIGGVAFALLRPGEDLALRGFADSANALARPTPLKFTSLSAQIEDWHRILTDLATAFAEADPIPDPKSYPKTCTSCTQRILCHLNIAQLDDSEDEPEPDYA